MSGRGRAQKTIDLVDACIHILEEIQPATVRAVCYRLFVAKLIPSMEKTNTNRISRLLTQAREDGALDWDWVVDETREPERISSWQDVAEFGESVKRAYRRDYWTTQLDWIEVWSEKGSVRGTLAPILNRYGITFRVMHGHGSATAVHAAAEETGNSDKTLTVLYVGDWDPSGMHMSEIDLPERLERYGGDIDIVRCAIHWEVDALPPPMLRERIEEIILGYLDMDAWERAMQIEAVERESMRKVLDAFKSISGQATK
jgi:hypothetical protein